MGNSINETTLFTITVGRSIQVTADGAPKFKAGGVTVDWANVVACPADTGTYYGATVTGGYATFEDNVKVAVGEKAIRYGTILMRHTDGTYRPALTGDTLKKSETYIVNETWLEEDRMSNHPGVIDGGRVFRERVIASAGTLNNVAAYTSAAASVPPTLAQIEAVMPGIVYAID